MCLCLPIARPRRCSRTAQPLPGPHGGERSAHHWNTSKNDCTSAHTGQGADRGALPVSVNPKHLFHIDCASQSIYLLVLPDYPHNEGLDQAVPRKQRLNQMVAAIVGNTSLGVAVLAEMFDVSQAT